MLKRAIVVWGATSGAGKSFIAAALARLARRRGLRAAPFKAQNMSNNARAAEGFEIATAQYWQALAAGVAPQPDHNPVLLKPEADTASQVVVHGRIRRDLSALPWRARSPVLAAAARESFERLAQAHELLVIEGAGSPAEINLADCDFVNLEAARWAAARAPTAALLAVDIDRGGAFAHAVGTLALLPEDLRPLVRAVVLNRFRGDAALLEPGRDWLRERTGAAVAVLPMLHGHALPEEDGPALHGTGSGPTVGIVCAPRASNLDEFSALAASGARLRFVRAPQEADDVDLLVLPGSKQTISDLAWLRAQGLDALLRDWAHVGRPLLGICGGMQMMGRMLHDPLGLEGAPGSVAGLGLFDYDTTLETEKQLRVVQGRLCPGGEAVRGYEIHMGVSAGPALARPAVELEHGPDGARSADGQLMATYLHGLFDAPQACAALLAWAGLEAAEPLDLHALREASLDRLADCIEAEIDVERMCGFR